MISLQSLSPLTHTLNTEPPQEPHFPFVHICESLEG